MSDQKPTKLITYLLPKQKSKVYLVRYRDSPNPNRSGWWIPAPTLNYGEHPDECAKRICQSLGFESCKPHFSGIDSFVTRDWHILFNYTADVRGMPKLGPEYASGQWFELKDLPQAEEFAHGSWERNHVLRLAEVEA